MSTEIEKSILQYLSNLGCCKYCCWRYLCKSTEEYTYIESDIFEENVENLAENGNATKKFKLSPCIICLGLLQEHCIDDVLQKLDQSEAKEYDCEAFVCSISMPACIMIREQSIRLHLQDRFPNFFKDKREGTLNVAWKCRFRDRMAQRLNKTFANPKICNFSINITFDYEFDTEELAEIKKVQPEVFKKRSYQRKKYRDLYTRKSILHAVTSTDETAFKTYLKVPPEVPTKFLTCKQIDCSRKSVYLGGRYCKYSRELSQTPWIISGVKTMETSVQEIIFEEVMKLGISEKNLKFCASGREDCDVRCLGNGRPFYIEIMNPKKLEFSLDEILNVENKINETKAINVRNLQHVSRYDLSIIRQGEMLKTKDYIALCVTKELVTQEHIDKINNYGPVDLDQRTPIRVVHRRPNVFRSRKIYKMEAKLVAGRQNLFELFLETQAGTYIKEFVHGDFGRTKPSVGDIIEMEVDIAALDVLAVNVDWPKNIVAR